MTASQSASSVNPIQSRGGGCCGDFPVGSMAEIKRGRARRALTLVSGAAIFSIERGRGALCLRRLATRAGARDECVRRRTNRRLGWRFIAPAISRSAPKFARFRLSAGFALGGAD